MGGVPETVPGQDSVSGSEDADSTRRERLCGGDEVQTPLVQPGTASGSYGNQSKDLLPTVVEGSISPVQRVPRNSVPQSRETLPENNDNPNTETDTNLNPAQNENTKEPERHEETREIGTISPVERIPSIRLTLFQKFAIASGHFQNDLCAALWFSYLLLYFEKVVGFTTGTIINNFPGTLMLIGQVVDGISTPLVGYEVDHTNIWPYNYGRCKSWHLWGSAMVLLSFPFIFSPVIGGSVATSALAKFIYYVPFIAIFQIGWASVQISHLAIIPKMHPDELVRTELFSIRYAFTVVANITIFLMTWFKLRQQQMEETSKAKCEVDTDDTGTFMIISVAAVGLGIMTTLLFHFGVKEENDKDIKEKVAEINSRTALIRRLSIIENSDPELVTHALTSSIGTRPSIASTTQQDDDFGSQRALFDEHSVEERLLIVQSALSEIEEATQIAVTSKPSIFSTKSLSIGKDVMTIKDWLSLPQTYIVAFIYMSTRLSINLGQVYIPFYLQDSLQIECTSVALIPLTMYISGFVTSFIVKILNKYFGRQLSYAFGMTLEVTGCLLILTLDWEGPNSEILKNYVIYGVAVLLGAGASAILVTSLSITADLIGNNIESGAFVYGAMSFCDKVSCGLAIVLVDSLVPCPGTPGPESFCNLDANVVYYKDVVAYSVGGCAIFGVLGVILLTLYILRQNLNYNPPTRIRTSPSRDRT